MMTATGELQALEISRDGAPITVLDHRRSAFTLNGQSYTVRASGTFQRIYEMRRGDEVLASAKTALFGDGTTVTYDDKSWLLKSENFRGTRFGLYDGTSRVGGVAPVDGIPAGWSPWKGATIDMPDALPLDAQLFVTSIVLFKWDEANSAD